MDTVELFSACRKGDLVRVEHLVEQNEVEVNVRDNWDSTPLYYACLCGHEELVKYLLENGAKCEASTFDGERCLYGALNNDIRNLLKNYKAVTSTTIRRDLYYEFLRKLLERGGYEDLSFIVHGESFHAHRCILAARSEYFAEMFKSKWQDRPVITLNHKLVLPWAFKAVLQFLYTARLESPMDQVEDILLLARQCRLTDLIEQLENRMKEVMSLESTKPGVRVTTMCLEPTTDCSELHSDLADLADRAIPLNYCDQAGVELPFPPEHEQLYTDVIFSVERYHFNCHKAFFCGRSDYFKALLDDHFGESWMDEEQCLPVIPLHNISAPVFVQVICYLYGDNCDLNEQNVYDILVAADIYLLPGLKRHCATVLSRFINTESVVSLVRMARLFSLGRLEDQCAEFIASHLEKVISSKEFAALVVEDAGSVKERQETDSIPVIDDIRFHITNCVQTFSDMYDADQKLNMIDAFLEELALDA